MTASADPGQFVVISGSAVAEGSAGQADQAVFTVALFGNNQTSNTDITFRFQTSPMHTSTQPGDAVQGTACTGEVDYIGQNRIVTFPAHTQSVSISVPLCGDNADEANESFGGLLFNVVNADCLTDSCGAVGTILNDDATPIPAPAPLPTLSVANTSALEGDGILRGAALHFRVTLAPQSNQQVTVHAATALGDKTVGALAKGSAFCFAGVDYENESTTVTFDPGQTTKTVSVTLCGDNVNEPNENLALVLSAPTNATIADGRATGLILDDD